jgi:hypothetical protein
MSTEEQSDNPEPEDTEDEGPSEEEEYNEWAFGEMTQILQQARSSFTGDDAFHDVSPIESESDSPDDGMSFSLVKDGDRYRISIHQEED